MWLGAILLSDAVLDVVRRELRRLSPNVKIEAEEIKAVMLQDVMKREVLEGDKAELARKQANRASNRPLKSKSKKDNDSEAPDTFRVHSDTDESEPQAQSTA